MAVKEKPKQPVETKRKYAFITVDSGKYNTKGVRTHGGVTERKFDVPTTISATSEKRSMEKKSFVVTMDGESTLIGSSRGGYNFETSKAQDVHRRATYLAITKLADESEEIVLSIGCPLSVWDNTLMRENYMRFMLQLDESDDPYSQSVEISFEVDGVPYTYTIKMLVVYPETSGYLMKNEENFAGRSVALVDIGGLNINGVVYQPVPGEEDQLEANMHTYFTINEGGNVFKTNLAKALNAAFGMNIQDYEIDEIIKKGFVKRKPESEKFIKTFMNDYLDTVRQNMRAHSWSVETLDYVFTGGGSIMFKKAILAIPEFEDAVFSDNAVWDNAEGFGEATEAAFIEAYGEVATTEEVSDAK